MIHFISIQNSYDTLDVALFTDGVCISTIKEDKKNASKLAIPLLNDLLKQHALSLTDISFIGVNYGPGPFATLRVVIATVNGLSFATQLPLIGIDGLDALLAQSYTSDYPETVALLNAFNKDVYFGIQLSNWELQTRGYDKIETLLAQLQNYWTHQPIRFIGNATSLYQHEILSALGNAKIIIDESFPTCSVEQIGLCAYEKWKTKSNLSHKLTPRYLKNQQYKTQQGLLKTLK